MPRGGQNHFGGKGGRGVIFTGKQGFFGAMGTTCCHRATGLRQALVRKAGVFGGNCLGVRPESPAAPRPMAPWEALPLDLRQRLPLATDTDIKRVGRWTHACPGGAAALKRRVHGRRWRVRGLPRREAGVVELADTPDLGSGGASRGGSNPSARTITGRWDGPLGRTIGTDHWDGPLRNAAEMDWAAYLQTTGRVGRCR